MCFFVVIYISYLQIFYIRSAAFVLLGLEVGEVGLVLRVLFEDGGGFGVFDAVFLEIWDLVVEEEGVDAFVLIVGTHGYEQEIEGFHLLCFEGFEEFDPSEWEESAACLTQGLRDVGHADAYAYDFVVLVDGYGDEIEVDEREIHLGIVFFLALCEWLEVVERLIGGVDDVEIAIAVFFF